MSARGGTQRSDSVEQLAALLDGLRNDIDKLNAVIARGALPPGLVWVVTPVAPGPPPTFQISILNTLTGSSIALAVI